MRKLYSDGTYDAVKCTNCGEELLLPCGCEQCPNCRSKGSLMWLNPDEPEIGYEEGIKKYPNAFVFQECEDVDN